MGSVSNLIHYNVLRSVSKVVYEAPNRDLGLVRRTVQFTFDVSGIWLDIFNIQSVGQCGVSYIDLIPTP